MAEIEFNEVGFVYQPGTPFEVSALRNINLTIESNSYTAIVGHTGSGKSTLIQLLDGLLKPTSGRLLIGQSQIDANSTNRQLAQLHQHIGIVFQFPENQLFEETVIKDIAFGPKNFGKSESQARELALEAMELVGLNADLSERSPFELSGGQMRRVAIAGVLAMQPHTLILDEPTAGLDPRGQREIMELFASLQQQQHLTVILVTHQMEDAAQYADKIVVMNHGEVVKVGTPRDIFVDPIWLKNNHLMVPKTTAFAQRLQQRGFSFDPFPLTVAELAQQIKQQLESGS
ncbi:energy-coupling factor ABC transporter ATP-binding protein [Paucilactobacillus kaifaensis]|uniref:energy-coupling factor ABC transporter ATP-binding protein n=1 Tax=Paucilactobacillus kaifaensis TaxID=2559921 RepID=UPI0010F738D4|nr:energy-coupling factor ABC transporter ATP-binding protein [Paucilactobacillus kaifaensis]